MAPQPTTLDSNGDEDQRAAIRRALFDSGKLGERVNETEMRVSNVEKSVGRIEGKVDAIVSAIEGLRINQSTQGKFTVSGFILMSAPAVGLVLTLVGSLWALAINPIQTRTDSNANRLQVLEQESIRSSAKLVEIETQFDAAAQMENLRAQYEEREAVLRDNVNRARAGEPEQAVPTLDFWPNISNRSGGR